MKIVYNLGKEEVEEIIQAYFLGRINSEEPQVTCLSKEANFKVEIEDMLLEDI